MPDDGFDPTVMEQIQTEIKTFGDNINDLGDKMRRDLTAMRGEVEAAEGKTDALIDQKIDTLSASIAEKHAAIEQIAKDAKIAAQRPALGGSSRSEDVAHARSMSALIASERSLSPIEAWEQRDTLVPVEQYQTYVSAFGAHLRMKNQKNLPPKIEAALKVGEDPEGGYFIPAEMSDRILSIVRERSPIRELATVDTGSRPEIEYMVDEDDVESGWEGELEETPETSTAQIGKTTIPANWHRAKPKITVGMMEDAGFDVAGWLMRKVGDKFAREEGRAFVVGSGTLRPRGLLTYPPGAGRGKVTRVMSGHASLITPDSIIDMVTSLKESYVGGASWIMNRNGLASILKLKDENGQYLWSPGLRDGTPSMLWGYPVRLAVDMPNVVAGALPLAFGDFRQAYTVYDRRGISVIIDPYTKKPSVEYLVSRRVGGDVTNFEAYTLMEIGDA